MPSRCLWARSRVPGQRRSWRSCLSRTEPSIRSTYCETAARILHRAKVQRNSSASSSILYFPEAFLLTNPCPTYLPLLHSRVFFPSYFWFALCLSVRKKTFCFIASLLHHFHPFFLQPCLPSSSYSFTLLHSVISFFFPTIFFLFLLQNPLTYFLLYLLLLMLWFSIIFSNSLFKENLQLKSGFGPC